ncbi:uncharacterized protein IWZ02DRAFT_446976, partial [Phyllosticta citriasiana]
MVTHDMRYPLRHQSVNVLVAAVWWRRGFVFLYTAGFWKRRVMLHGSENLHKRNVGFFVILICSSVSVLGICYYCTAQRCRSRSREKEGFQVALDFVTLFTTDMKSVLIRHDTIQTQINQGSISEQVSERAS